MRNSRQVADQKNEQRAQVQAPEPEIEITYNTRFLSPPFEEIEAASYYLRKRFPKVPEELLNECLSERLNVDGFNKGTVVYVVARKSYGRRRLTEAQGFKEAVDGARITIHAGADKLAEEVKVYGPIHVRDHWIESEKGWDSGLDRSSFFSALGKIAAPWALHQPDAAGKKNGEFPKFVTMSYA